MSDLQWSTDKPEHDMHSCLTCRKKYNAKDALLRELVDVLQNQYEERESYTYTEVYWKRIKELLRRAKAAMKETK